MLQHGGIFYFEVTTKNYNSTAAFPIKNGRLGSKGFFYGAAENFTQKYFTQRNYKKMISNNFVRFTFLKARFEINRFK